MRLKFLSKIQGRIFLYLFLGLLLPFLLILGTTSFIFKKGWETTHRKDLIIMSHFVSSLASNKMNETFDEIRFLSRVPEVINKETLPATKKERLVLFKKFHPMIAGVSLLDNSGNIITSTDPVIDKNLSGSTCYTEAQKGAYGFSNVQLTGEPDRTSFFFCVPIFNEEGLTKNVLVGEIETSFLSELIQSPGQGGTNQQFILDVNGTIIAHPEKGRILSTINAPELIEAARQSKKIVKYRFNKETWIAAITPMQKASYLDSPSWYAMTAKTKKDLYWLIDEGISITLLLGAGMILLVFLIGLILSRGIIHPLDQISEAALRVSEGEYDVEVPVESDDEWGQLADIFNRMTKNVHEETVPRKNVDQLVYRKTQELKIQYEKTKQALEQLKKEKGPGPGTED